MSLSEILEAVSKLSPGEKAQVAEAINAAPDAGGDLVGRQEELNREFLAEGWVKRLPVKGAKPRPFKRIKLEGKPLSETVIEERR